MKSFLFGLPLVAALFISLWAGNDDFLILKSGDEFVNLNFNGQDRKYTSENKIRVIQFVNENGIPSTRIRLVPNKDTYSHFHLNIPTVKTGEYLNGDIEFSFLDYSKNGDYKRMNVSCTNKECPINFRIIISEYGNRGEKIKGKLIGDYIFVDEPIHFEGEFDVLLE